MVGITRYLKFGHYLESTNTDKRGTIRSGYDIFIFLYILELFLTNKHLFDIKANNTPILLFVS